MKIENSDIDCLIDISVFLKGLSNHPENCRFKEPFEIWHSHIRKVYILLLQASEKGNAGTKHLTEKGINNDNATSDAIRLLCPSLSLS